MARNATLFLLAAVAAVALSLAAEPEGKEEALGFVAMSDSELSAMRDLTRRMFTHAYDSYMAHAWPHDELRPLSCTPHDGYGRYMLTLIDSLDTLLVLGNVTEFERACATVTRFVTFDTDANVSVFETNIRVLGGLLSGYLLAEEMDVAKETRRGLLSLAEDIGRRLLPAFDTKTGIPYGTVNLRHGVPPQETTVTSTAGGATFALEFGVLSRLTGDRRYDDAARRAILSLWKHRSPVGLLGNHIDTDDGQWIATDASVGSATDSFYEYLLKASLLFDDHEMQEAFLAAYGSAMTNIRKGPWMPFVSMVTGNVTLGVVDALAAFWSGLQVLHGDVAEAEENLRAFHHVWKKYGALPELWGIGTGEPLDGRSNHPLRPEFVESLFFLSCSHPSRGNLAFQRIGARIAESLALHTTVPCGHAAVADVRTFRLADSMDSFFLAETTKYLYLLFDTEHWLRRGGHVFTTEAHVFPFQRRFQETPPWLKSPRRAPRIVKCNVTK